MTLKQALDQARERLSALKDAENPALESEVLLRHTLNFTRAHLYLDINAELDPLLKTSFNNWVERRLRGEPLAYIIQSREFYGLDFFVDKRVLIPRPETELLVEEAFSFCKERPDAVLADIGTGSGAIAVSLAVHLPEAKIYATDISPMALEVANLNARKHGVESRLTFLTGDLLEPLNSPVDALIANLPYVAESEWQAMPSAAFEPRLALDGGKEGFDQLFRLIVRLKGKVSPGGCVLLEIGMGQAEAVKSYLKRFYPAASIDTLKDLADIERVVRMLF